MCVARIKTRLDVSRYRKGVNDIVDSLSIKQQSWLGIEPPESQYLSKMSEKSVEKRFVVYGFDGKMVAFFDFFRDSNRKKPNLLACCAVHRQYQGRGYGEFIVKTAMNWFFENGSHYGTLYWKVSPENNVSVQLAVRNRLKFLGMKNGWAYYCDDDTESRERKVRKYSYWN